MRRTNTDSQAEPEPNIILTLTLTQADELWDALGERPHREDWSREIRTNLWDRLEEIRA